MEYCFMRTFYRYMFWRSPMGEAFALFNDSSVGILYGSAAFATLWKKSIDNLIAIFIS